MIGRDFSHVGADNGIYCKYGDGYGYPYRGPVKTVFLDGNTVAVMDADKGIYVQRLGGTAYYICPPTHALETMKSPTASDSEEEDDKRKVETEAFETNYVDVDPTDMCTIPMTENVAISDRSNVIKIINKYEWFIDSTVGSLGSGLGMLSRASSIDSFQIGAQIFFVVAECGNQRIQILSEGCKHIMSAGGAGPLAGQFRDPVSIAAFSVPYPFKPATATAKKKRGAMDALNASRLAAPNQSKGPVNRYAPVSLADKPDWYHGVCQFRDLRMRVARKMKVGSYALGKRVDDHSMYDFVFVSQPYEFNPPTIEHVAFRIEDGVVVNTTEDEKGMDTGGYDCLWTAICKYNKFLRHGRDKRAFVNIAVADVGNHRVQIFKYYYSTYPDLYLPELEVDSVVGGAREQVVHLEEPVAVAYTTTGELIICDVSIKKVVILSPAMHVIVNRHFSFDFSPNMHLISSRPGTRSNNESGLAEVGRRRVEVPTYDHKACTVSVARDGKIAIGFKCGGMIVYKPYIAYAMGALEIFTVSFLCISVSQGTLFTVNSVPLLHIFRRIYSSMFLVIYPIAISNHYETVADIFMTLQETFEKNGH